MRFDRPVIVVLNPWARVISLPGLLGTLASGIPGETEISRQSTLLSVVNVRAMHLLAVGVGTLEGLRQRLAVLGYNNAARLMKFPASFFRFPTVRICVDSFNRKRVKLS